MLLQIILQLRLVLAVRAHKLRLLAALEAPMPVQIVAVPIVLAAVATLERRGGYDGGARRRRLGQQFGAHARHCVDDEATLVDGGGAVAAATRIRICARCCRSGGYSRGAARGI